MSGLRILFVIYGSEQQLTGGYIYDRRIIEALRERGDEVDLLRLDRHPLLLSRLPSSRRQLANALQESSGYDWIIVDELVHPLAAPAVSRWKRRLPPDSQRPRIALLVHLLAVVLERKGFRERFHRRYERMLIEASDLVIANSDTTAANIRDLAAGAPRIVVCRPGKDAPGQERADLRLKERQERYRNQPAASREVRLLIAGTLVAHKGHHYLIQALAGLKSLPWRLVIAGNPEADPRYTRKIRQLVEKSSLRDRVTFTGALPVEQMEETYLRTDLFLFPTAYESYGMALAEAITYGIPFVAFDVGAVREIAPSAAVIRPGERSSERDLWKGSSGFFVPFGDIETFSACASILITDRILRGVMGERALADAAALPDWSEAGDRFHRILHGKAVDAPAPDAHEDPDDPDAPLMS